MPGAYYNEFDPFAAAWLRELIKAGHIADGDVDDRSILEVTPDDVRGYTQCHFFAGIGGWSYALRLAGWDDARPVWTASLPCQPFSAAGKGKGHGDPRNLWPAFHRLVSESRPVRIFGEQVEAAIGFGWLDGVFVDLEGLGYACGAAVLPAASVGAPHIRHRLYWVADRARGGLGIDGGASRDTGYVDKRDQTCGLADATDADRWTGECSAETGTRQDRIGRRGLGERGDLVGMGDADRGGLHGGGWSTTNMSEESSPWAPSRPILCRDGKYRRIPTEPAFFPLVDGVSPARVGILRGAGNAIVPQVAAAFVSAYMDTMRGGAA